MNLFARIASLRLRLKLSISAMLAAFAIIIGAGVTVSQYASVAQPVARVLLQTAAQERLGKLNVVLSEISLAVTQLTTDPATVQTYVNLGLNPDIEANRKAVESAFQLIRNLRPNIQQIRFVTLEGDVQLASPPVGVNSDSGQEYYRVFRQRPPTLASNVYFERIQPDPSPSVNVAGGVFTGNQLIGYVVVTVDLSSDVPARLNVFTALETMTYDTGRIIFYLTAPDGEIESPWVQSVVSEQISKVNAQALAGQSFAAPRTIISPLTGRETQGFVAQVPDLRMALVAENQTFSVRLSQEGSQFLGVLLIVATLALVLLVLNALYLEATVVAPARRLTAAAERAMQGRQPGLTPINQRDEIGQLYAAFSGLLSQSRQNIGALEARIAQRTRDIEATRDIGQVVSSIRDLDQLLPRVVDLIRERFEDIYHAQVFLVDPAGDYALLRASTGEAGAKLLQRGHKLVVGSQSVIGKTTGEGQPIVALDTSNNPVHQANELLPETRAELALPLRSTEGVIGALDLQSKRPDAFTDADVRLFQSMADQLGIAITNARLFEESRSRLAEIENLSRRQIGEAWRDYASIRRRMQVARGDGHESDSWSALQVRAMETGEVVQNVGEETVTLALPVSLRGETIGAIEWDIPRSAYNENTLQLAHDLAARFAITADNTRLFEQSQRLASRERLVNEISSKLTQQTNVTQILQIAVKELGQALRVPQTSIRLAKSQDGDTHSR